MNRIRFFTLITCLAAAWAATGAPVSESQARIIAANFLSRQAESPKLAFKAPMGTVTPAAGQAAYYVYNAATANRGFVVVAGDDRVPAILGYSDSGHFDAADVPPAMQEWLDGYTTQIEAIAAGAKPEQRTTARAAIAPLLPVRWGQGTPYNIKLPHINGSENAHAYTGCVATAMAQIMAYWQYPPRPITTIPGYTSNSGKTTEVYMPALQPTDFNWQNMQDTYYTNDTTSTSVDAVSTLMLYCSTSLQSSFGTTGTGAYTRNIPGRLINYYGFKNSCHYLYRKYFSTQSWEDTIYAELAAGRPVAYAGNKQSAGHAFVCDGYDGQGMFHINWGWAGKSNGYFLLNLLNPSAEGIGSAAGAYGYVLGQGIGVGLEPDDGTSGVAAFTFDDLVINSSVTTRGAASSNFSVTVSGKFVNYTNVSARFSQGWGLFRDGEMIENLFYRSSTGEIGNEGYITVSARSLNFGAGLTSGTYRILPIYTIYGADDWHPCIGSDVNYIEVTINDTYSCSIRGYGNAGSTTAYSVNSCGVEGTLNHGKPVVMNLNLTNTGTSTNDMVYMFVNGEFTGMGLANLGKGETGNIVYRFTPTTAGTKTITFSLKESGTPVLYTKRVTIATMPTATLDVSYRILNITDEDNRIITADRYSIIADITNNGTTTYNEDFSVRLYRVNNESTNVGTELLSQSQPLVLGAGESTSLQFDFDHDLIDGWKYFCYLYYYSAGEAIGTGTKWYTLNLINAPTTGYSVTTSVTPAQAGTISLTGGVLVGKAQAGDTVTFTVTPAAGYTLGTVNVNAASGDSIETTLDNESGIYSFIMPEQAVTVSATFDAIPVYSIAVTPSNDAGGRCSLSTETAMAGETVTITASPYVGWQCDSVTATASGTPLEVNQGIEGEYSFTMPEGDVDVMVFFSRSTGNLFELVETRSNITEGGTYILVSRTHDKVMRHWSEGDDTFQADDVTGWANEGKSIVRVNDEAGFFTMAQVADTTVSSNERTAAYLTNGNAYMRTSNYNVLMQDGIVAESRAWMYIGNASNCLIRFKDSTSGSNSNWIVRYDSEGDEFQVMNWNVTGAEGSRVWLYKLVDAYSVTTATSEGGTVTVTGGLVNGTAQSGETVTFTATPDEEFTLAAVSVTTATGQNVEFTVDDSGINSFVMPAKGITIGATFEASSPGYLLGDVNNDGDVTIKDVTSLIDYLLSGSGDINTQAADCSVDGSVTIKDVTALIDYLLSGTWP